jgi:hypothetical protein
MGLTKRKDGWYVEFPVVDDGKGLTLARGTPWSQIETMEGSLTTNKTVAKAITNMRRAGIDHLTIMRISGHKTMACFTRYNSFREPDLLAAAHLFNTYLTETTLSC